MSEKTSYETLQEATFHAIAAQRLSLELIPKGCGVMYPFGRHGEILCPICSEPVYMHLGFPDQQI